MKKFYRISDAQMAVLEMYMDSAIREEVHFRYASCTNEEFLVQVSIRNGINTTVVEEVLNRNFDEVNETFVVIYNIKGYMH